VVELSIEAGLWTVPELWKTHSPRFPHARWTAHSPRRPHGPQGFLLVSLKKDKDELQ
jgi:hypothetical protein